MAGLTSVTRLGVRLLLSFIFLFAGANKVTEISFFPGVYQQLSEKFVCYGNQAGVPPQTYQFAVGVIEIVLALLLWFQPGFSTLVLLAIMGGAVGSHVLCNEPYTGALVPAAFLLLHLLLIYLSPSRSSSSASSKKKKTK